MCINGFAYITGATHANDNLDLYIVDNVIKNKFLKFILQSLLILSPCFLFPFN